MAERSSESLERDIKKRYEGVLMEIAQTAEHCNRDPSDIRLVVVTKSKSLKVVKALINSGCRIIGESYVQEALEKMNDLKYKGVEWHMIGHIQSRKARDVCGNFAWVHSLDRMKIANRLNQCMKKVGESLPVLLECNVSGEESKYGFPTWQKDQWAHFKEEVEEINSLSHLVIRGLMTIPPWNPNPEASRPYYRKLIMLRNYLKENIPELELVELSMGMSNDYKVAIQEGATIVRIGTAIVGPRN